MFAVFIFASQKKNWTEKLKSNEKKSKKKTWKKQNVGGKESDTTAEISVEQPFDCFVDLFQFIFFFSATSIYVTLRIYCLHYLLQSVSFAVILLVAVVVIVFVAVCFSSIAKTTQFIVWNMKYD